MKFDKLRSLNFNSVKDLHLHHMYKKRIAIGGIAICLSFLISCTFCRPAGVDIDMDNNISANTPAMQIQISSSPSEIISTEVSPSIVIEDNPITSYNPKPSPSIEPSPIQSNDIIKNETQETKMIALSFDDGPSNTNTLELLKILEDNDCTATFFVIGNLAEKYPDIVYDVYEAGNEIGNHSYDHSNFTKLTKEEMIQNFTKTEDIIYDITNEYPVFFRPPGGNINDDMKSCINSPIALWSIDSNDWRKITDEQVINNVISNLGNGKIILMHDINKRTIEVCKTLIPEIKKSGYQIVSISELFNEVNLKDGSIYSRIKKN